MTKGLYAWSGVVPIIVALSVAAVLAISAQAEPPPPPGALGPTLDLHTGWNMISSPVSFVSLSSIQGDCSVTDGPWWWDGSQYQAAFTIEPGRGFWIKVAQACTMQAIGRRSTTTQAIMLRDAWNMISSDVPWVQMNRALTNTLGGCKLESGPWWWDGQRYQLVHPDEALDSFKGYWVKVFGGCNVSTQSVHRAGDDSLWPPGPPATSESPTFFATLLQWLGFPQMTSVPQAMPLALQGVHLVAIHANQLELQLEGRGIRSSELRLYNLSGQLVAAGQGSGSTLHVNVLGHDRLALANGVYLYVVTVRGADGQTLTSEVRKLVVMR